MREFIKLKNELGYIAVDLSTKPHLIAFLKKDELIFDTVLDEKDVSFAIDSILNKQFEINTFSFQDCPSHRRLLEVYSNEFSKFKVTAYTEVCVDEFNEKYNKLVLDGIKAVVKMLEKSDDMHITLARKC